MSEKRKKSLSLVEYRNVLTTATDAQLRSLARRGCDAEGLMQVGSFCQLHTVDVADVVKWFEETKGTMRDFTALVQLHCGPDELDFVSYLSHNHQIRPRTIVRWMKETGANLEQTGEAAHLRDQYGRSTGVALLRILVNLDLQDMPLDVFMAPFEDAMDLVGGEFPLHHLIHIVEDQLDGDWYRAHQYAAENPYGFAQVLQGKLDVVGFGIEYLVHLNAGEDDLDLAEGES